MANQQLNDLQIMIDTLFRKLDDAKSGGEITQYNHSLRVQITKKKKLGGSLTERERDLLSAVGAITAPKKGGQLWIFILVLAVIGGLYLAYRYIVSQQH